MRILQLTPGTGSFLCGSCLRDNTLAQGLIARGHDVTIAPLYLPFVLESDHAASAPLPVRMGGINMYLQQKLPWLRLPRFAADLFDSSSLLRWAASHSNMTDASGLGAMTLSMLRGEEGRQAAELEKLILWLESIDRPDVVVLSNAMLIGLARRIRRALDCPVVCTFQGEAPFLDALSEPFASDCWRTLTERAADIHSFVAVSRFTGELMSRRLALDPGRVHVVPNGIELDGFAPAAVRPERPTIGFLARLCTDKGLPILVDAFLRVRERVPGVRLLAGGVMLAADRKLVRKLKARIAAAGATDDVEFRPNLERAAKIELLQSLSVLSVPATYGESFGLYVLEALACGVPVAQPRHGGFPEIIEATGGGLLCEPDDVEALAQVLEELLLDPDRAQTIGERGREAVLFAYGAERMALDIERILTASLAPLRSAGEEDSVSAE